MYGGGEFLTNKQGKKGNDYMMLSDECKVCAEQGDHCCVFVLLQWTENPPSEPEEKS